SSDRTLKVWNLQTGQVIASIGLDGALQCVAVTRQDDHMLVVAGDAGGALYCLELVEPVGQFSVGSRALGRFADEPAYEVK
ncbi:MAG: hypothetical protein KDE31_12820, partial [Caldilineaceae bacterium]|nr:hypothetical protein [Caldilineaceae bacterium]